MRMERIEEAKAAVTRIVGRSYATSDHPITATEIAGSLLKQYGIRTTGPVIRHILHALRIAGALPGLCANARGYYFPRTAQELIDYTRDLETRERQIRELRIATRNHLGVLMEQGELFTSEVGA